MVIWPIMVQKYRFNYIHFVLCHCFILSDYILRGQVPVSTIFNMETRLVACMLLITMATATYVDVSSMVLHEVSPYFLSFTTDDTVFEPSVGWGAFNFRLVTWASSWVFLAPPAERQQSFFNAELSVVCLSVCLSRGGGGGGGVYLRNASVTFLFFLAWSFFWVT